jgi:hypothetical protein
MEACAVATAYLNYTAFYRKKIDWMIAKEIAFVVEL